MTTYSTALTLQARAAAAVSDAGVDDVLVTLDGEAVPGQLDSGASVVLITPPAVEHTGAAVTVETWTVYAIVGESVDVDVYWPALDAIADALADPLEVDRSEAMVWRARNGLEYPALQLTLTT